MATIANCFRADRRAAAWAVALLGLVLCGCRDDVSMRVAGASQPQPPDGIEFGKYSLIPKARVGSLPYPGAFTLFEVADPNHLGSHAYNLQSGEPEVDRGIIYTCRGGFVDMAHLRKSADLCEYVSVRVEMALLNDWTALRVRSREPSTFTIYLQYPPFWKSLTPAQKSALAHELSIRIGQRVAMVMVTWHELLTWFGYQASVVFPERQSAFTWDDTGTHALGVTLAGVALRDAKHDWDEAMTIAINDRLRQLGAVAPKQTLEAVEKIKGVWWSGFEPLKRQFEVGWDGQPVQAWLVRGLPFCDKDETPARYLLPRLDDVMGRDFRGLLRVEIQPNVLETDKIRDVIPGKPKDIDVDKHLPVIMEYMKRWHLDHEGPQSLRPY